MPREGGTAQRAKTGLTRVTEDTGWGDTPDRDPLGGSSAPSRASSLQQKWADLRLILRSGVFDHVAYDKMHLGNRALPAWLCVAHYIWRGEAAGLKPNAFFDPAFIPANLGACALARYLRDRTLWARPTSALFDGGFYADRHHPYLSTAESPLEHFWRVGFDRRLRPHPRVDMRFLHRAVLRDYADKRGSVYERLSTYGVDRPFNLDDLAGRQARYRDKIHLEILRRTGASRPNLVFIQCGGRFAPPPLPAARTFDLHLNVYDNGSPLAPDATTITRQPGSKVTGIAKILEQAPHLFTAYESVFFLDDDIEWTVAGIEALFSTRQRLGADALQPALTADSSCYFEVLKQPRAPRGSTNMTAIEIMMPLLSRRALEQVGFTFGQAISGWAVDLLLCQEIRKRFGDTIYLDGDTIFAHRRPTDTSEGTFYRHLADHGIDASVEAGAIAMRFGVNDTVMGVRGTHGERVAR